MSDIKYPDITVQLTGRDGNAIVVLNTVLTALREADIPVEDIQAFSNEAMSGDYDHLLQTCMKTVNVR